jgi:segregation and condensation protein B
MYTGPGSRRVERLLLDGARSKLTRAALETLAVVAYRQPVTARGSARSAGQRRRRHPDPAARGLITEAGPTRTPVP